MGGASRTGEGAVMMPAKVRYATGANSFAPLENKALTVSPHATASKMVYGASSP